MIARDLNRLDEDIGVPDDLNPLMSSHFCAAGINGTWKISGAAVEVAGERYMQIQSFYLDYTLDDLKAYASNLVDGAPDLSEYFSVTEIKQRNIFIQKHISSGRACLFIKGSNLNLGTENNAVMIDQTVLLRQSRRD